MPLRLLILGLSLVVLVSACDAGTDASSVSTPEATPYTLSLESARTQLSHVDSYEAAYDVYFEGTRGGQAVSGHITSVMQADNQDDAAHIRMTVSGDEAGFENITEPLEYYRRDNTIYVKEPLGWTWFEQMPGTRILPEDVGLFDLNSLFLMPKTSSAPAETDTFEGEPVTKWDFTEHDLSDPNVIVERAAGTIWLDDENLVRRYALTATLRFVTPIPHAHILDEGDLALSYEVTGLNERQTIRPPRQLLFHNSLAELPRPDDAELTAVYPALLEYTSAISPVSATLFYQNELSTLGWTSVLTDVFEEKARLAFSKDDQTNHIIINPAQDKKVKVVLSLDRESAN